MWSEGSRMHYCCPDLRLGCRHGRLVCGRMYTPVNGKGIFLYTSFGVPDEEWCWWLRGYYPGGVVESPLGFVFS